MRSSAVVISVDAFHVELPLKHNFSTSAAAMTHVGLVITRLRDSQGNIAYAEAQPAPGVSVETPESVMSTIEGTLGPYVLGKEYGRYSKLASDLAGMSESTPYAMASVADACFALRAAALGLSISDLLGGRARDFLACAWVIGLDAVDKVASESLWAVDQGYTTVKVKIGRGNPAADIEVLRKVRAVVGTEVRLRADANGAFSLNEAVEVLRSVEDLRLEYVEQPLPRSHDSELAELFRSIRTPIMVDESITSMGDLLRIIGLGCVKAINLKPCKHGGIWSTWKIATVAAIAKVNIGLSNNLSSSLGVYLTGELALSIPTVDYATEFHLGPSLLVEDISSPSVLVAGGHYLPAPELRIHVDDEKLAHYVKNSASIR